MNVPNRITLFRILLVPFFIGCLVYWGPGRDLRFAAFGIFLTASVTDALDGYLSRRLKQQTRLGVFIDPLADKALLTSAFLGLAFFSNIPAPYRIEPWLALLVVSRDVLLLAGAFVIYALSGQFEPRTNFLGKLTTFLQMTAVLAAFLLPASGAMRLLGLLTAAATLASTAIYIGAGAKLLSANGTAAS